MKEDRHQNIMSSVALKKGVEEPWTIERVVKFIDLLGYHEITLKSDTEPAIIKFRNRVAAMCQAEVTTEDAVEGDKESNGLIENAVVLLRGIIRTIKCHIESRTQEPLSDDSLVVPWLVEHAGCTLSRCQKGRDGKTPFERRLEADAIICPVWRKGAGKTNHNGSEEQNDLQISVRILARDAKQQRKVLYCERRWCVQSSCNSEIGASGQMGHRGHQQCD